MGWMHRNVHQLFPTVNVYRGGVVKELAYALDARIAELQRARDNLDGCIGCGCLSLKNCTLYNPDDTLAAKGPGPRAVIG